MRAMEKWCVTKVVHCIRGGGGALIQMRLIHMGAPIQRRLIHRDAPIQRRLIYRDALIQRI